MTDTARTDARIRVLPGNLSTIPQAIVVRPGSAPLLAEIDRSLAAPERKALVHESLAVVGMSPVENELFYRGTTGMMALEFDTEPTFSLYGRDHRDARPCKRTPALDLH